MADVNVRQTVKFQNGDHPTAVKNAEHGAFGSLVHSAQLKRKIEKPQLFNLYL